MPFSFFFQRHRLPIIAVAVTAAAALLAFEFLESMWAGWFTGPQAMLFLLAIIAGAGLIALAIDTLWLRPPAVRPGAAGASTPAALPAALSDEAVAAHAEDVTRAGDAAAAALAAAIADGERGSKNVERAVLASLAQADALLGAYRAQPASIASGKALAAQVRRFMGAIVGDDEVRKRIRRAYREPIVARARALIDELAHIKREDGDEATARLVVAAAADGLTAFGADSETVATVGRNLIARERKRFPESAEIAERAKALG